MLEKISSLMEKASTRNSTLPLLTTRKLTGKALEKMLVKLLLKPSLVKRTPTAKK